MGAHPVMEKTRIWDLPTRLFHWALVACVVGLVVTGNIGGAAMEWHCLLGYAVFTLLLFRLVWGFVGGYWSRWWQLPLSWPSIHAYWQGRADARLTAGHNPLGSWSVLLLLGWLALQVGTGLVSDDEIASSGPLVAFVSGTLVSAATAWHKGVGKGLLIAWVVLHVLAIVWYKVRKGQALVPSMFHGDKRLNAPLPASRDNRASRLLALLILVLCAMCVRWVVSLGAT